MNFMWNTARCEDEARKPYRSDVSDEEWLFIAPLASYFALVRDDSEQRRHNLREVFNALRWLVRSGAAWRMLSNDLPAWEAVYQQTQRWIGASCFEAVVHDLRELLRIGEGRKAQPSAVILDSGTLAGFHFIAFTCLMLPKIFDLIHPSS